MVIPMLRAVPATDFIADSTLKAFKSTIFVSAMVRTWSHVTEPTLLRFGSFEPLVNLAAAMSNPGAGADFTTKSNDLSVYMVISTGQT